MKKKKNLPAGAAAAGLAVMLFLSGCAPEGGLFSADDYYLVNGSSAALAESVPEEETKEETAAASSGSSGNDFSEEEPEQEEKDGTETAVSAGNAAEENEELSDASAYRDIMQTVWIAYWDPHVADSLDVYGDVIENICLFAASYNTEGQVFLPDDLIRHQEMIREKSEGHDWKLYLSVTNDVIAAEWSSAKDVDLLHDLLDKPEKAKKHAAELAELAVNYGFDGLEIDYECLHGDLELWKSFLIFEKALIEETEKRSLPLRIVLEPATPKEGLDFPEGPEYVMMCYDLHGFGTEPGAKADKDFLIGLVNDFSFIPDMSFALANGGYDWNTETGYTTTLSEQNVRKILETHDFDVQRGDTSGALYGIYEDEDKDKREIWYADAQTLQLWYRYLCDAAGRQVRCSLWKL